MRNSAGGAATAGGTDFENRVAAWVAVRILGEKDVETPWDLPTDTYLEWIRCQTEQPVDDLLIGTSTGGTIFVQVKSTVNLSKASKSDLSSSFDQFTRQFIVSRSKTIGTRAWERPLDLATDRLVLIVSPTSSEPIRIQLPVVLRRLRTLLANQPIEDAALNNRERQALFIAVEHIRLSWLTAYGTQPSDRELRELLSLIHVFCLDLCEGGHEEREARMLLRHSVLKSPSQDNAAWSHLVTLCAELATMRSGADRLDFQRQLLGAGFQLMITKSYRKDIERLQTYSKNMRKGLTHLAEIRVGPTIARIDRPCSRALRYAAEEASVLVVGEPGAGKSGTLHDLVEALSHEERDCIFMAVDRVAARSLGLLRGELGLDHELVEVLENWTGTQPGFLVVDALDAARGDASQEMMQDLIRQVFMKGGRWHVVASIRKFDLRYGVEVKALFAGSPIDGFQDPEFADIRHLNVPQLSDNELDQVNVQSVLLFGLIVAAPEQLHDLLRVPFNLRLMADLLGIGTSMDELTPIKTELELLDRYWQHRVVRDAGGDDREAILRRVCNKMIDDRALLIGREHVAQLQSSRLLNDLLSTQVLIEWQPSPEVPPDRYVLAFSHNVLFDYAVATLLFRGKTGRMVERLVGDPSLVIMIRPSVSLHFCHSWAAFPDRNPFWELVFGLINDSRIPQICKLVGPSVAADLATTLSDLEPLILALDDSGGTGETAGEQALGHLVAALLSESRADRHLVGHGAGPWCELLERVTRNLQRHVAYTLLSLLRKVCDQPEQLTLAQKTAVGESARRLLEFAWSQPPRNRQFLVIQALKGVCRTFESEVGASSRMIRRCLEPAHLSQFGYEEIPWLAREVRRLINFDAELVEDIYRVVFGHEELSGEKTSIGQSRILSLTSTRRQDYRMAYYELAMAFPTFLEFAPRNATRSLIATTEAYITRHHHHTSDGDREESFDFNGKRAKILKDFSCIWDEGDTYRHDDALKMIDAFQQYLVRMADQAQTVMKAIDAIQLLVSENRRAVLWRRILDVATRYPDTVGMYVLPLAWALPILTGFDTSNMAGEFLRAIYPIVGYTERERIEQAILRIPESLPVDRKEAAEHVRNRLLGCLKSIELVTETAKNLLGQLISTDALPSNEPPVTFTLRKGQYREEDYLRDQGVPIDAEANQKIRELERPVREFGETHLNSLPVLKEAEDLLSALETLYGALTLDDSVHPKQREHAWAHLVQACARIAKTEGLTYRTALGLFVAHILLEASRDAQPAHDPASDAQFDDFAAWGSPAPRIDAAEGLVMLLRHESFLTSGVLESLQELITDSVPAVRFQIVSRIHVLYQISTDLMWRLIEIVGAQEPSRGVLQGLLSGPLQRLAGSSPDRVTAIATKLFGRVKDGPGAKRVRELCMDIFTGLYIWQGHHECGKIVLEIADNPVAYINEAPHLLTHLREPLTHGPVDPASPEDDAIRHRTFDLLERVLRSADERLREIDLRNSAVPFDHWTDIDRETATSLAQLIDTIARELYFSSGAQAEKGQDLRKGQETLSRTRRFYREASSVLDYLAKVGLASVTHHLLEILELLIPIDPKRVFLAIGRVVRAGQRSGYQYEALAVDLIVRLVERYLAEHRTLLRQDDVCAGILVEVLDVFVQAGWPSARKLTYGLEDIFR